MEQADLLHALDDMYHETPVLFAAISEYFCDPGYKKLMVSSRHGKIVHVEVVQTYSVNGKENLKAM